MRNDMSRRVQPPRQRHRRFGRAGGFLPAAVAAILFAGCQQQQKKPAEAALTAPRLATTVDHFLGTPLSGPTTQPAPVAAIPSGDALSIQVSFVALQQMPTGGDPLGARAKLIAA